MQANPPIFCRKCHNTVMLSMSKSLTCSAVLRIQIHIFLGLLDLDLLVRRTDLNPGPSIIKQKYLVVNVRFFVCKTRLFSFFLSVSQTQGFLKLVSILTAYYRNFCAPFTVDFVIYKKHKFNKVFRAKKGIMECSHADLGFSNSTKAKGGPRRFLRSMKAMAPYLWKRSSTSCKGRCFTAMIQVSKLRIKRHIS